MMCSQFHRLSVALFFQLLMYMFQIHRKEWNHANLLLDIASLGRKYAKLWRLNHNLLTGSLHNFHIALHNRVMKCMKYSLRKVQVWRFRMPDRETFIWALNYWVKDLCTLIMSVCIYLSWHPRPRDCHSKANYGGAIKWMIHAVSCGLGTRGWLFVWGRANT